MEKEVTPSTPQTPKLTGALAGETFKAAVERRIADAELEMSAEDWTELARQSFYNAAGQETPRPAPSDSIQRFDAPDPNARLPSIEDVKAQMPPNTRITSRIEFEQVGKDVLKNDPDDLWEFFTEVLDRVFGREKH